MTVEKKSKASLLPLAVALRLPARVRPILAVNLNILRRSGGKAFWDEIYGS